MAYIDDYIKTNWANKPSTATPLNQTNLNHAEQGIKNNCGRIANLSTTKAEQSDLLVSFKNVTFDSTTGTFTFTKFDNTTITVNTDLEKLAVNFDYDDDPTSPHYQNLVITLSDGTIKYADLSALVTQYEFTNTSTISFTIGTGGVITANVIDGSITADKLQPNFLADCQAAKTDAENAANAAESDALKSEGYAKGTQNGTPVGPDSEYYENNAEYFKNQAGAIVGPKVTSFNGRSNIVLPAKGDYDAAKIEFNPSTTSLPNTLDTLQDFLEYAYPPSVSVTLTLNGAKEDSITIYDSNNVQVGSCVFGAGQTSGTCQIVVPAGGGSYKFVSSVAGGTTPETLSNNYEKTATLTDNPTQTVNVYPDGMSYWYENGTLTGVGMPFRLNGPTVNPTLTSNTNSINYSGADTGSFAISGEHNFTGYSKINFLLQINSSSDTVTLMGKSSIATPANVDVINDNELLPSGGTLAKGIYSVPVTATGNNYAVLHIRGGNNQSNNTGEIWAVWLD